MKITVDSCVFVESVLPDATFNRLCFDILAKILQNDNVELIQPTIWLFEFTNAVGRQSKNHSELTNRLDLVKKICQTFTEKPKFILEEVNKSKWEEWYKSLATNRYKFIHTTQDEQFLYTASKHSSLLVTLEKFLLTNPNCASGNVKVVNPYEALKLLEQLKSTTTT